MSSVARTTKDYPIRMMIGRYILTSLSVIVSAALAGAPRVALLGLLSARLTVSSASPAIS